jgi:hypothetical protein
VLLGRICVRGFEVGLDVSEFEISFVDVRHGNIFCCGRPSPRERHNSVKCHLDLHEQK